MKCPYCGHPDSKVIDSREADESVRRRRECLACSSRFTTYERIEAQALYIIKKDQRREEFSREKLLAGLRRALEKRPLPAGGVEKLADEIEAELRRPGREEVASRTVGELVMERLRRLDRIAYIRFASVYRDFKDVEDLEREVEALKRDVARPPRAQLPLISGLELDKPASPRGRRRKVAGVQR
ncbi:MAG: transcriptional repressor NrdR [Dehalococcoidia bacterium]|nr:transcriptional repressor NrdR [Dehalococcoidia bacterium]